MSLTCNPSVGVGAGRGGRGEEGGWVGGGCNARVCIKGNRFIHFAAPPVMAELNSLFHLFNLGNLCG